jgi:cyclopropane fatty-acyl-phospholipid synthase-like methyltransferase
MKYGLTMGYLKKPRDTEDVYQKVSTSEIPWNMEDPPEVLVNLVENSRIKPCRCIDLGCGTGNYSIYLAKNDFDVTGIDISPSAIGIAKENALGKGVRCNFIVADVLHAVNQIQGTFDFAFDWEVLHHVFPQKRKLYVESVFNLLNPGGTYVSVCFSDKDPQFGGKGKYRHTPLGTHLYFSSENELRRLFQRFFRIDELSTIEISGKGSFHNAHYALMEKL